jgi:hypothetical protein
LTVQLSALGFCSLASCQLLAAKCCCILPFIRPYVNEKTGPVAAK